MLRKVFTNWRSPVLTYTSRRFFFTPPKYDTKKDYYGILEVDRQANEAQLKKAYYRLARDYHPDHNKGHETKFKQISEAYEILSDPKERKSYNRSRDLLFMDFKDSDGQNINFQQYKQNFHQMNPQQQAKVARLARKALLRIGFVFGFVLYISYSIASWLFRSIKKKFVKQEQQQNSSSSTDMANEKQPKQNNHQNIVKQAFNPQTNIVTEQSLEKTTSSSSQDKHSQLLIPFQPSTPQSIQTTPVQKQKQNQSSLPTNQNQMKIQPQSYQKISQSAEKSKTNNQTQIVVQQISNQIRQNNQGNETEKPIRKAKQQEGQGQKQN